VSIISKKLGREVNNYEKEKKMEKKEKG